MPLIGIVAAHGAELRPLLQHVTDRRIDRQVVFGRWRGVPVALQVVGQGWSRAHEAAGRFFRVTRCAGVIITGFAGATEPGWAVGDGVMPETVVDDRRDGHGAGDQSHRSPFPVAAWQAQLGWRGGALGTVTRVVVGPSEKAELGTRLGIAAVDLETAAVAAAAARDGVPWAAARVILDPMDRPLAVVSPWHAAWLAISIAGWGRLGRFGQDLVVAQRRLGDRLGDVVDIMNRTLSTKDARA